MINKLIQNKKKSSYVLLGLSAVLLFVTVLFHKVAVRHQDWIEEHYSRWYYQSNSDAMNRISNFFPFAIGEIFILGLVLLLMYLVIHMMILLVNKSFDRAFFKGSILVFVISVVLFHFTLTWGLNNYRLSAEELFDLGSDEITIDQLADTYRYLVEKANAIVDQMSESDELLLNPILLSKDEIFKDASLGYQSLAMKYPFISPNQVRVKPLMISSVFSQSGYTGVYLYFFSEATVNAMPNLSSIPFTAYHEIAHQKGFAGEDEASFVGFLAGIEHPKAYYRYSAYLGIMTYVGNSLYQSDPALYQEIAKERRVEIVQDYQARSEFWKKYQDEKISRVHNRINDAFLKANNQPDGILNYNKVTELIVKAYIKGLF